MWSDDTIALRTQVAALQTQVAALQKQESTGDVVGAVVTKCRTSNENPEFDKQHRDRTDRQVCRPHRSDTSLSPDRSEAYALD